MPATLPLPIEDVMPLRVFQDHDGQEWRVWFVMPAGSPGMLGESFRDGWLCFERTDGHDRRRLAIADAPPAWDGLPDERLDTLRKSAEPAQRSATLGQASLETNQRDDRSSGPKTVVGEDGGTV
ncbi:MAG TPA: hypothetical protein VGG84_08950 [Gemmatimonadaceae bacterium]|jgi:hypothetical protein